MCLIFFFTYFICWFKWLIFFVPLRFEMVDAIKILFSCNEWLSFFNNSSFSYIINDFWWTDYTSHTNRQQAWESTLFCCDDVLGARTIRCRTIRRGQFVADNSSHGQFVAGQFVAGQFVARTIRCMNNSSQDNSLPDNSLQWYNPIITYHYFFINELTY